MGSWSETNPCTHSTWLLLRVWMGPRRDLYLRKRRAMANSHGRGGSSATFCSLSAKNDSNRAERIRGQIEAAPLPVKIRYLSEYMAWDRSTELAHLSVPLLAIRPGFNEKFLAEPANSYYKASFQDSWDALAKNPRIQL